MDVYVARQPVFDREMQIHAYELLYRSSELGQVNFPDALLASCEVLVNSFFSIGWENLLGSHKGLLNVPEKLLTDERLLVLPPSQVSIEILEDTQPTPEVLEGVQRLKTQGFTLLLDDYVGQPHLEPFLGLVDCVKVDWPQCPTLQRRILPAKLHAKGRQVLAEKIETYEEYQEARTLGYDFFQGYFLERPRVVKGQRLPSNAVRRMRMLSELARPDFSLHRIAELVRSDLDLSYKLIRWVNSAAFDRSAECGSVLEALIYLGEAGVRRFFALFLVPQLATKGKEELARVALTRGRFSEELVRAAGKDEAAPQAFLCGLFSMLDAMLDRPMPELVSELRLPDSLSSALLAKPGESSGEIRWAMDTAAAYQHGDWGTTEDAVRKANVDRTRLPELYLEAVAWASQAT